MKFTHNFKAHTPLGNAVCAEIWMDPDTNWGGGYEIWDEATGGNRIYVEGVLETEDGEDGSVYLIGYDGCFELPEYIIEALEKKGVIIDL